MSANYGPKKQYGKQKTYGKAVKTHVNGWFAHSLWTNLETKKTETDPEKSTVIKEIVTKEPSKDIDSIVSQLDNLGISEEVTMTVEESRASIIATEDLNPESSASSLRESSDKENEFIDALSTPQKPNEPEQSPLRDPTPRQVLGECESISVKESPPRKRGLRKRTSVPGTGIPSPLKNEIASKGDREPEWKDSIRVWEDGTEGVIVEKGQPFEIIERHNTTSEAIGQGTELKEEQPRAESPRVNELKESGVIEEEPLRSEPELSQSVKLQVKSTTVTVIEDSDDSELSEISEPFNFEQEAAGSMSSSEVEQLLQLCTDPKILDFTACIDSFFEDSSIRKLGEASYSEVFLQFQPNSNSTTVLKIIPFGQNEQCEVKSITQEVRITKAMSDIEGFIGFKGAYVVQGYFPGALLDEWDAYDEERGSENERPEFYEEDQLFVIIMLENGGSDLEHTELGGWEEAIYVFWQVAFALARGENERQFEHRDLHFGNIVIRREQAGTNEARLETPEYLLKNLSLEDKDDAERIPALKVALIDYTLSRACCGDLDGDNLVEFIPLDDQALFTGKGDYQFDIYRFMRNHVSSGLVPPEEECIDWNVYAPRTNVFWLHYLANVLLTKMGIPKPAARGRNAASERERECFKQLEAVGKAIDPRKTRFGKAPTFETADQLVKWAVDEGLVEHDI